MEICPGRPPACGSSTIAAVMGGFALFLLFSYALSWGCGCLGIVSKGPFLYRRRTTG